ncbi:MAG: alkaline phosphatase family protein [Bacteroidales bacterium]|nr:alkaline phosphatase family protein [Bacteroidales bacterium]
MKTILIILFTAMMLSASSQPLSQQELLNAGPMVGYSEMQEVMLWVQTKVPAVARIVYWDQENPNRKYSTDRVITSRKEAFTAHLVADSVEPGNQYGYELYINNRKMEFMYKTEFQTQTLWQWRTDPPDFRFAAGSCAYFNEKEYDRPGEPYGNGYDIFMSILRKDPNFMLWMGDNVYLREADWNTRTGILHRYTHDRATPQLQPLLASVHHYAIWDDHDYGPNNSNRSWWNKEDTYEAFKLFWANPSYGIDDMEGAITFFEWNDMDFFLLDNRTYRTPNYRNEPGKTILGEEQLQWLFDALTYSRSPYKFVVMGGQFLNTSGQGETYSNYGFEKERQRIIDFIYEQGIQGVVFLTGDRHHSELSILKKENKPTIWDLTLSSLTAGPHTTADEETNTLQVDGTLVMERNFGMVDVKGPRKDRKLIITVFDTQGEELWTRTIER